MKLIVLEGNSKTGKTTTLGILYDDLILKGATVLKNKTSLGRDPNDFECIVNYNGKKIAIYTMGDFSTYLSDAISDYDNQGCDVMICTLSTSTAKVKANNKISRYNGIRVPKTLLSNTLTEKQANSQDVNTILGMI